MVRREPSRAMPALLMRMSNGAPWPASSATAARTEAMSDTSPVVALASRPSARTSSAVACALFPSTSMRAMLQPSRASLRAMARPMPAAPPVISARLPASPSMRGAPLGGVGRNSGAHCAAAPCLGAIRLRLLRPTPLMPSIGGPAAVESEDRAGGEAALVARQEQDARGDLLGRAESAHELPLLQLAARGGAVRIPGQDLLEVGRVDGAGGHRVAADAVGHVVDGHRPRQRRHRTLGRAVGGAVGDADGRDRGGRVDDGTAAVRLHDGYGELGAQEHTAHVDGHQVVPGRGLRVEHAPGNAVAGVVDEHVEAPEGAHRLSHHVLGIRGLGDVHLDGDGLRAQLAALLAHGLGGCPALVGDRHPRALAREQKAGGAAYPRAAAGDDADLVLETHGRQALSLTHAMMCCATPTSSPFWLTTLISLRERRFTGSTSMMVSGRVTVSPMSTG